ncbi:MAG TPA: hypothetical protein VM940_15540 [Chthoniobacterales bacterium]|jgi:hypothetical protein|nr:hypothetical protein [Chthoniobacterales bacterium]
MKNKLNIISACAAVMALSAASAFAAPKSSPSPSPSSNASPAAEKTDKPARAIPFRGKISAVDQTAKTFTIAGKETSRIFKITDKTVITKSGAAATMADIVADEQVSGSYWKQADGTLEAKSVKLGPKAEAEKKETKASKKKSADAAASPSPSAKP